MSFLHSVKRACTAIARARNDVVMSLIRWESTSWLRLLAQEPDWKRLEAITTFSAGDRAESVVTWLTPVKKTGSWQMHYHTIDWVGHSKSREMKLLITLSEAAAHKAIAQFKAVLVDQTHAFPQKFGNRSIVLWVLSDRSYPWWSDTIAHRLHPELHQKRFHELKSIALEALLSSGPPGDASQFSLARRIWERWKMRRCAQS